MLARCLREEFGSVDVHSIFGDQQGHETTSVNEHSPHGQL
jgi:hypothetical protein